MSWEVVIGLEVHARLLTASKLFCGCPTAFGAPPNTNVCPICLGYPGALPVVNRRAVELAVRMGLAAGCEIHVESVFARKNYFYPDLPKGYQISQFDRPIATGGSIDLGDRSIPLTRIHIEEDAGKLIHERDRSLVDLNRAGTALIEIVSEPEVRSAAEAVAYFTRLRQILMYTEVCDGNMEEGSLRCDANVSVRRAGEPLGTRAEIKNLNSFRFLSRAIEFETERQIALLESGGKVVQETRLFDPAAGETRAMRSKEEAHDYRYFPDPDLPPLIVPRALVEETDATLPALPAERIRRYQAEFGLSYGDADVLTMTRELAEFFEATAAEAENARSAANWVRNEVLREVNDRKIELREYRVTPAMLARLIRMIDGGALGGKAAKEVFEDMSSTGEEAEAIVARKGLGQVSDLGAIREAAQKVLDANAGQVAEYKAGKQKVFGFLVGQLMKEMRGRANAEMANQVLRELLG
ncbi:MAG TPA: Asp-tRNA(Asn)/Glu-tRNA(Gln) amidotransferase subunit GatB [Thermoanaerobaculia bacterium]|nr:Asp-tRNA(Asn)/Glu-tRNA(Gln) amidotransferase subunit GatB [Thermoanaerobaculia bacterium]